MSANEHLRKAVSLLKERLNSRFETVHDLLDALRGPLHLLTGCRASSDDWVAIDPAVRPAFVAKHLPSIQALLLDTVYTDWNEALRAEDNAFQNNFMPFFTQDIFVQLSAAVVCLRHIADAGGHINSKQFALDLLAHPFSLTALYASLFTHTQNNTQQATIRWNDAVRLIFAIPAKVANSTSSQTSLHVPTPLEWSLYLQTLCKSFLELLLVTEREHQQLVQELLAKFINVGYCQCTVQKPSFWTTTLPKVWTYAFPNSGSNLQSLKTAIEDLTSQETVTLATTLFTTLSSLSYLGKFTENSLSLDHAIQEVIVAAAQLCELLFGALQVANDTAFKCVFQNICVTRGGWSLIITRVLVAWSDFSPESRKSLLEVVIEVWSDEVSIAKASVQHRSFLTLLLLLLVMRFEERDEYIVRMSRSEAFLAGVQKHISTLRDPVRYLGMLTAELVSSHSLSKSEDGVKPLSFGDEIWAGDSEIKIECRSLRQLALQARPRPALTSLPVSLLTTPNPIVDAPASAAQKYSEKPINVKEVPIGIKAKGEKGKSDPKPKITLIKSSTGSDDDDLAPFPLPAEDSSNADIDLDDLSTFTPSKKKVHPPVYIADLSKYLRASEDAEKIEIGLKTAAGLIRKKAHWGKELEEHVVDLMFALLGLHNNFELEQFDDLLMHAIQASIVACPHLAAPTLIEQYFTPAYSHAQRFNMLAALAISARELSGKSIPEHEAPPALPSKNLPKRLDRKLAWLDGQASVLIDQLALRVTLDKATRPSAKAPQRLLHASQLGNAQRKNSMRVQQVNKKISYSDIAHEHFVIPLINHLWQTLEDVSSANQLASRTQNAEVTSVALTPILLAKLFSTLAVLLDAAQLSPYFLSILVPECMDVVTATRRPLINQEDHLLAAQLELLLVALNSSYDIDKCRTLLAQKPEELLNCHNWAAEAFSHEIQSQRQAGRVAKAAAAILLRIEDLSQETRFASLSQTSVV